jgi:hypothetical protein
LIPGFEYGGPRGDGYVSGRTISEDVKGNLKSRTRTLNVSFSALIQGLFGMWFSCFCEDEDVLITGVHGRRDDIRFLNTSGYFLNDIVYRYKLNFTSEKMEDVIRTFGRVASEGIQHGNFPIDSLLENLGVYTVFDSYRIDFLWTMSEDERFIQRSALKKKSWADFCIICQLEENNNMIYLEVDENVCSKAYADNILQNFVKFVEIVGEERWEQISFAKMRVILKDLISSGRL